MKPWLNWTYGVRALGVLVVLAGLTGLQWPPVIYGSVVIAGLGFLGGPDALRAMGRGDGGK